MRAPFTVPEVGYDADLAPLSASDSLLDACETAMAVDGHVEDADGDMIADYRPAWVKEGTR
jgi:hypothetical protein